MATAFAVFCATDGSLIFYNRDTVPAVGDTFEGKAVSNIYTGINTLNPSSYTDIPWYADKNYKNIANVSFVDTVSPINMSYWFHNCQSLTSLNLSNLNTSKVTNMSHMFENCYLLTDFDFSNFDTSNVTDMNHMFTYCATVTSLDLSNFNTSKVTNMQNMFDNCQSLASLNLSNWDTSNVTDMSYMFSYCYMSLTSLDLSHFNTSNVTNMGGMFNFDSSLTSLDLSNFDTSNVTNMNYMFNFCSGLKTIYVLKPWVTTLMNATSIGMFQNCTSLVGAVPYDSTKVDATMANYITGYFTDKAIQMLIRDTTLYNIANEIRILYGTKDTMTPAVMNSNLNTFNTELSAINVEQDGLIEQLAALFGFVMPESTTLDGCSWENISKIAAQGNASNFWSIGDTKKVVLNGMVGTLSLDNFETYVYIIGFDHNGATGTIDFGTFKTADGRDGCLCTNNQTFTEDGTLNFNINHWGGYNYGGWAGCDLRYDILGSTDIAPSGYGSTVASGRTGYDASSTCATNPVANTLMAALPSELRAIMKPMTIYTDNVGGFTGDVESNVTASVDYLPLLAEFEVFGTITNANDYEQNNQAQYAYYANGSSCGRYRYPTFDTTTQWFVRSRYCITNNSGFFCAIYTSSTYQTVKTSWGLAPIFRV